MPRWLSQHSDVFDEVDASRERVSLMPATHLLAPVSEPVSDTVGL